MTPLLRQVFPWRFPFSKSDRTRLPAFTAVHGCIAVISGTDKHAPMGFRRAPRSPLPSRVFSVPAPTSLAFQGLHLHSVHSV